jgi:hypothetical protein
MEMMKSALRLFTLLLLPCSVFAASHKKPPATVAVEDLMSAAEFKQAGLQKLSPTEIAALNRWLSLYSARIVAAPKAPAATSSFPSGEVIESNIDGDFEGWDGETIFKLDNGQIWQQSSYSYTYHYSYHPKVTIYHSGGSYRMKVEDVEETIPVKRLK